MSSNQPDVTLKARHLTAALLAAYSASGCGPVLLSTRPANPRKLLVTGPDGAPTVIWAYLWNLTPGGRPARPEEYRIQLTGVDSPLLTNPDGHTLMLGYKSDLKVFAGFDLSRHHTFSKGSPSVQISMTALRDDALATGFGFDRKANGEIAVGIRPDFIHAYAGIAELLHSEGAAPSVVRLLRKATVDHALREDEAELPEPQQRAYRAVLRAIRWCGFREQVLRAYDHRCAITRIQLQLVDAAHVLPVSDFRSVDDVRNGFAVSPTYHRAYDAGLVYLDKDYVLRMNTSRCDELRALGRDAGLDALAAHVGNRILLPLDKHQWPKLTLIAQANRYRRIPGY
jgi:putative restriction endonuclease